MTATYRFHCRAIERDPTGYYHPRWDLATKVVVEAENREAAFRSVWAVMGEAPRGWKWAAQIDHIETVAASPAPQDAAQSAAEGAGDAVEGGGPAEPSGAPLCHECEHVIDEHRSLGCTWCICHLAPRDIARHLIAQAVGAERGRLAREPDPEPVVLPEGWRLDNGHDLIQPGDLEDTRVGVVARDHRSWYAMSATSDEWRVCDTKQRAVDFLRAEVEREYRR